MRCMINAVQITSGETNNKSADAVADAGNIVVKNLLIFASLVIITTHTLIGCSSKDTKVVTTIATLEDLPADIKARVKSDAVLSLGFATYSRNCVGCHGINGDGQGPAAVRLGIKPRNFTTGIFKFRSTPNGQLPLKTDLQRTIKQGLKDTAMPSFKFMPERTSSAVVEFIKLYSPKWTDPEEKVQPVNLPGVEPANLMSEERVLRGRYAYIAMGCYNCHGMTGYGDGPSSVGMLDDWGNPVKPYNYHQGAPKGGATPLDIYRTFRTGVTPMPMYQSDTLGYVTQDMKSVVYSRIVKEEMALLEDAVDSLPTLAEVQQMQKEDVTAYEEYSDDRAWDLVAYTLWLRESAKPERAAIWPADYVVNPPDQPQASINKNDTQPNG